MSWKKFFGKAIRNKLLADYYLDRDESKHKIYNEAYQKDLETFVSQYEQSQDPMYQAGSDQSDEMGSMRILHASTYESVPVDVYVNQKPVVRNLPFSGITEYVSLPSGEYQVEMFPAGRQDEAILSQSVTIRSRRAYTLNTADVGTDLGVELLSYEDDLRKVPRRSKVRLIHVSPDMKRVDISVKGGNVLFSDVDFREARFISLNPGIYTWEVRPAGGKQAEFTIPNITLKPGKDYTLFTLGRVSESPALQVVMVEDTLEYDR
ncbi:hypothetical protein J2Z48_000198 [Croceifilum oryzae]|uniref:DUF4397 domain-containing protein n=1 Tax=Croceifilum oryzae TaxID=1553429 RepID=A0AAJ1TK54_9BACL|nr:DUF4397 domain-containing protein [Croceifilum oryzae]MDQ0416040.1 hypothetical protein [Croceifilum oryzae]